MSPEDEDFEEYLASLNEKYRKEDSDFLDDEWVPKFYETYALYRGEQ